MREFAIYDNMLTDFYQRTSNFVLPLSCWEFLGEHTMDLNFYREDLVSLSKLSKHWAIGIDYYKELIKKKNVIVVTNPQLKIVYATQNILTLSGYSSKEVIGNSPKMFQGKDTCKKTARSIRDAVDSMLPFEVCIVNYRKDNTPYHCKIKGFPITNKKGELLNYIAFEEAA